ncbi:MAG: hypothetical protein LUG49_07830 [Oscillospiraceae bacterium]|nr:hypothetical protein [Oscillospiraceae bacterium]
MYSIHEYSIHEMDFVYFSEKSLYVQADLSVVGCDDSSACPPYTCPETSFNSLFGDC